MGATVNSEMAYYYRNAKLHFQVTFSLPSSLSCLSSLWSAKRGREIFIFEALKTRARSTKSFILCLYMETIRAMHSPTWYNVADME